MHSNNNIQNLLNKFILNKCSKSEVEAVVAYMQQIKKSSEIPSVEDVLELLGEKPVMSDKDANRIQNKVLGIIDKQNKKHNKNYKWKYTAAAILIGLLATAYFFNDGFVNRESESVKIGVSNNIVPGTDKATLTLEDGSVIALEKENVYKNKNVKSNGKEVVYKPHESYESYVEYNCLTVPRGGQFFVKLSDGTQVWLNSESQLKYPVSFIAGETRQVELVYGEAYFDVSPSTEHNGSKFKVINQSQEVEVLGTEFNIKAYKNEQNVYTTLVEGKVEVKAALVKQILVPNEQLSLNKLNEEILVSTVDVKSEISWKTGVFRFKGKPLKDIMKVLSRWYDVDVVFENKELELRKFKGVVEKEQSIEEILSIMKSTTINNYEIKNKVIFLN